MSLWTLSKIVGGLAVASGLIWIRRRLIMVPRMYQHQRAVLARRTWRRWS